MITFKEYLLEEYAEYAASYRGGSRAPPTSVKHLIKWMEDNSMMYLNGKHLLYRGIENDEPGFRLGDSTRGEPRVSANAANNYTLWMDNHPSFKGTPKRSRSFICSNNSTKASGFGSVFFVVPEDSARVGIVGEDDLWDVEVLGHIDINNLNSTTERIMHHFMGHGHKTYDWLVDALEGISTEELGKDTEFMDSVPVVKTLYKEMEKEGLKNLYELWEKLISPKLFQYTTGANISDHYKNSEIWVEGQCAFIPLGDKHIAKDARVMLYTWAKKHAPTLATELYVQWATSEDEDE